MTTKGEANMNIQDFKTGDQILITFRTRSGEFEYEADVTCINWKDNGMVTYSGRESGQGAFTPERLGENKFGIVDVRIVGHSKTWTENHWSPKPGDTGYDLMC